METKDFLKQHAACIDGAKWALSLSEDMAYIWEALVREGERDWLIWTATRPDVFTDSVLRKLACRFVRETPLSDGRKAWDLLTDERSRRAVEVAELYADGKATYEELEAAHVAAYDAAYAASDAAHAAAYVAALAAAREVAYDAADDAAYAAARDADAYAAAAAYAARDAAWAAAQAAQSQMIAELGNPFKEREGDCCVERGDHGTGRKDNGFKK